MSEYKPLLVFYLHPMDIGAKVDLDPKLRKIKEETGFPIIVMQTEGDERVELLSVDKATVIEDICKYLEEKILNRNDEK